MHVSQSLAIVLAIGLLIPAGRTYASDTKSEAGHDHATAITGPVLETQDAGRYTYVRVASPDGDIWAASTQFDVKVGDRVTVPMTMPMKDFKSRELKRTFDMVYFAGRILVEDQAVDTTVLPPGHPPIVNAADDSVMALDFSDITVPDGGHSIADVYANAADLAGKTVQVRGKAVKVNPAIMDRNWIHIQDGTGIAPTNDLLITTDGMAAPGDALLVSGTVATNVDYGHGYSYALVLEEAVITKE